MKQKEKLRATGLRLGSSAFGFGKRVIGERESGTAIEKIKNNVPSKAGN